MASHDPTQTNVKDWSYVSEGGATMVFSYAGPPHAVFSRTVLRVRKAPLPVADDSHGPTAVDQDEIVEPDDPSIEFQNRVTSLIIPPQHLPVMESLRVNREWLTQLAEHVKDKRPELRKLKDDIDLSRKKAVLATDLVGGKGWAVEIKPKWAFLPNPAYLSDETKDTKLQHCRFCMHSVRKTATGEKAAVGYCPLDLFSGKEERVRKALTSLWNSWIENDGQINNLKIFVTGQVISPSQAEELLSPLLGVEPSNKLNNLLPSFIKALLPLLVDTNLLSTMAKLQRNLDLIDIEGLVKLWQSPSLYSMTATALKGTSSSNPSNGSTQTSDGHDPTAPIGTGSQDPTMDEWVVFVQEYLVSHGGRDYIDENGFLLPEDDPEKEKGRLRYLLIAYLMSGTFKDCSIILRLGSGYDDTITAIDLDPKSTDRVKKWAAQDRDIVLGYKTKHANEVASDKCQDERA
ncbi:hypothetical protein CPB86DRAFT_782039 [Serendipita vermifera]|nr:hypothetical protein CPB86DRAFT_782039 [Serendipita vermifera]